MFRVFEGERQPLPRVLGPVERVLYRLCGVDPRAASRPGSSTRSRCSPSAPSALLVTYADPAPAAPAAAQPAAASAPSSRRSAFNTAASFTTNTNWQSYSRRVDDELPDADGGARLAQLHLGGRRHRRRARASRAASRGGRGPDGAKTLGNFWVDLIRAHRSTCSCRSASSSRCVLVSQGVIQNFAPYHDVTTLEGAKQILAHGPGRLAGGDQEARHQRRRLLQRQQRPPVREPDAAHQLPRRCSSSSPSRRR